MMLIVLMQSGVPDFLQIEGAEAARLAVRVVLIWGVAWLGFIALRVVSRRIVALVDDGDDSAHTDKEKRGLTIAQLVQSAGRVVIIALALLLTMDIFIEIGPLLAGAGVAGLAISFGAQSLVKDVLTGFFILMEDQFTVGDAVEIQGISGRVENMTLRVVMIRDLQGVLHTIPNGKIDVVSNKTRGWARAVVEVGVGYGEDVDHALAVFRSEAEQFAGDPDWLGQLDGNPEVVGVESLGDSSVVIRTMLRTMPGSQWQVAREFRRRIKNRLDLEGIEIPFPQRTLHVRQLDLTPDATRPPE